MPRRNIMRCLAATVLACGVACFALPTGVLAQEAAPTPAPAAAALNPAPPEPAVAMELYRTVDAWVRAWQVPIDPTGQRPLPAAAVTLRLEGTVVGRGFAISSDPAGGAGILMMATKRAMDEARAKMPVPRDALEEENLRAAAGRLTISVELAGAPVPFAVQNAAGAVGSVAPGLEGIALRLGDRIDAVFPSRMLTTGMDAAAAAASMVSKLTDDPTLGLESPEVWQKKHGAVLYRFAVSHLAQTEVGGTPVFLHRGGRIVSMVGLNRLALEIWAEKMAEHLWYRRWPGKEAYGIQGTYDPVRGVSEATFAGPAEQAVVALAMWRRAQLIRTGPVRLAKADAADWVIQVAKEMAVVEPGEREPWADPVAAALWWRLLDEAQVPPVERQDAYAFPSELRNDPVVVEFKKRCRDATVMAIGQPDLITPESGPVLVWAADRQAPAAPQPIDGADRVVSIVLSKVPANMFVGAMPWLGWARITDRAADGLREMRSQLWLHQLKASDLPPEAEDLAGGILFTTSRQPLPTWQSARPLAFMPAMLCDATLTPRGEDSKELARLLASLRFLRQLTAEAEEAHMYKDPARAIGGVRASPFDQRMPPEATAMTLLTVVETLRYLNVIQNQQKAPAEPAK